MIATALTQLELTRTASISDDGKNSVGPPKIAGNSQGGFTLVEMLVVIAVMAIAGGVAVTGLRSTFMNPNKSATAMMNALRLARADAITRGAHYQVTFTSTEILSQRMEDDDADGTWEADGDPVTKFKWPNGVSAVATGNDAIMEFNTRGMLVPADDEPLAESVTIVITDSINYHTRTVRIWPSGQVGLSS